MDYGKNFTIAIICESNDCTTLLNCLGSVFDIKDSPENIVLLFNNFKGYEPIFDIAEIRNLDLIKVTNSNLSRNNLESLSFRLSGTPYLIIIEDDTVVRNENLLKIVYDKHQESYMDIYLSEKNVAVSYDTESLRNETSKYKFDPYLIHHLRYKKFGMGTP